MNDKGPLLTSNGATDKAGARRSVPGGGFSVLGMAGYKQAFMIATTLMEACTSQCETHACQACVVTLGCACLSPRSKVVEKTQRGHVESCYCG